MNMPMKTKPAQEISAGEIIDELKGLANESYKKVLIRHGAREPIYGVKIEDLKKIQKRVKKNYKLALELYDSGISDAMYLAGLIADDQQMTKKDLQRWIKRASWSMHTDYTVPGVAAGSNHGEELALEWIESKDEGIAAAGWATLGGIVAVKQDDELNIGKLKQLLARVQKTIHEVPDRVRYTMNAFIIAVGIYVKPLNEVAKRTAERVGKVEIDMGDTACKVPFAPDYIRKAEQRGVVGKKRKTVKC